MNLNEYLIDEFPSPEYDREFINDLVNNYSGDINPNGDLLDNMGLFNYIWESLVAIEHPGTEPVDVVDDLDDLISDEKESEKYKVVLAPSFPDEYRSFFEDMLEEVNETDDVMSNLEFLTTRYSAIFEDILEDWEKEDENN
jgi:hypothetical protein